MAFQLSDIRSLRGAGFDTIIDVRSPSEYAEDHVPGAINLPVLDDKERARVGTIYTQESPFTARKIGATLVARNAARHLERSLMDKPGGWKPLIYCWRGGQRSNSFATILRQVGWRVEVLDGGYRSYRRAVAGMLHDAPLDHRFVVLDGNTGTAKTELLGLMAESGVQTIDLEGLAAHRGSLFGPVGRPQPSQKAFEGAIARALVDFDPAIPVVVEAESSKVGDLLLPPSLWARMIEAPRIAVSAPLDARAKYLVRAYADLVADQQALAATLDQLVPMQGREKVSRWKELAAEGRFLPLATELMADHYDPRYLKARSRQQGIWLGEVRTGSLEADDLPGVASQLCALIAEETAVAAG